MQRHTILPIKRQNSKVLTYEPESTFPMCSIQIFTHLSTKHNLRGRLAHMAWNKKKLLCSKGKKSDWHLMEQKINRQTFGTQETKDIQTVHKWIISHSLCHYYLFVWKPDIKELRSLLLAELKLEVISIEWPAWLPPYWPALTVSFIYHKGTSR